MLEIKNAVVVVVFIFLKRNGMCERLIPCTNLRVRVTPLASMLRSRS